MEPVISRNFHDLNREKVCLSCLEKVNQLKINYRKILPNSKLEELINVHFRYNSLDKRLPNTLCDKCRRKLYRVKNGSQLNINPPDLKQFNYKLSVNTRSTKKASDASCTYKICTITSDKPLFYFDKETGKYQPRKILKRFKGRRNKKPQLLCAICYSWIERGKRHKCVKSSRLRNVNLMAQSLPRKRAKEVMSTLVKNKVQKIASPSPPNSAKVVLENTTLAVSDMQNIKSVLGLTQNQTVGLASMLRSKFRYRKIIEPNLKKKLSARLHSLDQFFEKTSMEFTFVKRKKSFNAKSDFVYCKNLNGLIQYVKENRKQSQVHLKFGIDGGGGFLKLNLSIQSPHDDSRTQHSRQKYVDGVAYNKFLDTGVKKLFIIGLAQGVQEYYKNVYQLWCLIDINSVAGTYTIAVDLKLANIIAGLMAHSSLHPCTWCIINKDKLADVAEARTIGNITTSYLQWCASGRNLNTAKSYLNCINKPVFTGEDDKMILDIIPPPELHLMLGVVNHVFNHLLNECNEAATSWANLCNVERDVTNGGTGFNGNSCKKLLNNIDILRSRCPISCLKFVQVLVTFEIVVRSCFGKILNPEFKTHISKFKQSYLDSGISITPKVHAVFHHIGEFCSKHQEALGYYGEQAMEAVHFHFKCIWEKHKLHENHPQYSKHLLNAICDFNTLSV